MPVELLKPMRELRQQSRDLASTILGDHSPFQGTADSAFYFRLPSNPPKGGAVSVTPTCTAWMALCAARQFDTVHKDKAIVNTAYLKLLSEPWDTGRLRQNNAFTVAMLARSAGFLVEATALELEVVESSKRTADDVELKYGADGQAIADKAQPISEIWRQCHDKSLIDILKTFLSNPEDAIALAPFPSSPTIAYWMIDAASRLKATLEPEPAITFATWAAAEFRRQHSLLAAAEQATMDPIALAMAACVCKALRRIAETVPTYYDALKSCLFPTDGELEAGIKEFFRQQNQQSGVWEKYFPIFHYPASGPNHCWHFEVLEAVVSEFSAILNDAEILERLGRSLRWLSVTRLFFRHDGVDFHGWNAGGDIQAMRRGEPESWPTGVAHMFLARLSDQLSACIHSTVLEKFGDRVRSTPKDKDVSATFPKGKKWADFMDSEFLKAKECGLVKSRDSVKKMVEAELLLPTEETNKAKALSPHFKLGGRHSAVLFGPPGTSKTSLCEAMSRRLGWHFVELSPSDFLGGGLEGIYNKVTEIFEDLLDLYGVVILFDEMDALVQNRSAAERRLDITQTLLTTSMLPKLSRLYKDRRCLFFMATNSIGSFDSAIIRSERFDLLVHMGPPSTQSKLAGLKQWCPKCGTAESKKLTDALADAQDRERFGRFTYGETGRFLYALCLSHSAESVAEALQKATIDEIKNQVREWAKAKITLCDNTEKEGALKDFNDEALKVCIQ